MDYVKATIQYAMTNPQDENKKRYLNEDEGVIDTTPLDIPRPISSSHPLARNLSMQKILRLIQTDIKELEKTEYNKMVERSQAKAGEEIKTEGFKSSLQLVEEVKKKNELHPTKTIISPQRSKQKIEANSSVAILGNYVKNPKSTPKESAEQASAIKLPKKLPSARIREKPIKRLDRGLLMFKEIFVHPKEMKLGELHKRERTEGEQNPYQKECLTQRQGPATKKLLGTMKMTPRGKSNDDKELKEMMEEPDMLEEEVEAQLDEIVDIVMRMFNSKLKGRAGESFFSQQIQVQPPEGLNATVAAPLTPGGGWAPSIPGSTASLGKTSFKV